MREVQCFEQLVEHLVVTQVAKMVTDLESSEVLVIFPLCMYPGSQFFDYHQVVQAYQKAISAVIRNKSLVQPKVIVLCFPEGFENRARDLNKVLRPLNKQKVKQSLPKLLRYDRRKTTPQNKNYVNPNAKTFISNPVRAPNQITIATFKDLFKQTNDISLDP